MTGDRPRITICICSAEYAKELAIPRSHSRVWRSQRYITDVENLRSADGGTAGGVPFFLTHVPNAA